MPVISKVRSFLAFKTFERPYVRSVIGGWRDRRYGTPIVYNTVFYISAVFFYIDKCIALTQKYRVRLEFYLGFRIFSTLPTNDG